MKKTTFDIQQHITDQFITRLESVENNKWEKPFFGTGGQPVNVASKNAYRGCNTLFLMIQGFSSSTWGTYKQWQEKGAQVRKGQKATPIIFWKPIEKTDKETGEKNSFMLVRSYSVFNAEQVDGYEEPKTDLQDMTTRDKYADNFFKGLDIDTRHSGEGRAYYQPAGNFCHMPNRENFKATSTSTATEGYYSTKAHEYVHATMHESRLNREVPSVAFEECIAEIGSTLVMAYLGLSDSVRDDHIIYVKSWLKALKNDKTWITKAASKAQKALDWMVEKNEIALNGLDQAA